MINIIIERAQENELLCDEESVKEKSQMFSSLYDSWGVGMVESVLYETAEAGLRARKQQICRTSH